MLSGAKNSELLPEWASHVESAQCRLAFNLLVGMAASSQRFACYPQRKGDVRDFRFYDVSGEQYYAFIVNRNWLLFYFRAPAVRSGTHSIQCVKSQFGDLEENGRGEWTIKLSSIEDVMKLSSLISW